MNTFLTDWWSRAQRPFSPSWRSGPWPGRLAPITWSGPTPILRRLLSAVRFRKRLCRRNMPAANL